MKKKPIDTMWPPDGVVDLKPDGPVSVDVVRFPVIREAMRKVRR